MAVDGSVRTSLLIVAKSLLSSLRRRYLYYFRRAYVDRQLRLRKGNCDDCGAVCCLRTRKCFYVKDGKCSIYDTRIPKFCKIFPIDGLDIKLAGVEDVCQFTWEQMSLTHSPPAGPPRAEKEPPGSRVENRRLSGLFFCYNADLPDGREKGRKC